MASGAVAIGGVPQIPFHYEAFSVEPPLGRKAALRGDDWDDDGDWDDDE
jgi:hypothetical protein